MMFVLHPREEEWGTSSVGRTFIRSCSPHVVGRQTAFASPNATERCRRVNQAQGLPSLMCRFVANESGLSCIVSVYLPTRRSSGAVVVSITAQSVKSETCCSPLCSHEPLFARSVHHSPLRGWFARTHALAASSRFSKVRAVPSLTLTPSAM